MKTEAEIAADPVVAEWMFDIIAAADVLVDQLRYHPLARVAAEALDNYIATRNRHARPASGHAPRLAAVEKEARDE